MPHKRAKRPRAPVNALEVSVSAPASSPKPNAQPRSSLLPADLRTLPITPRVPPPPAWLRDVDVFFRRQAELDATVAATRAQMARLEAQVAHARAAHRTELERLEVVLFRWRVAVTALHALDAHCWGCPSSQGAHEVYESWAAVRAANDWVYLCLQPPQIRNAYQLLTDEEKKWEHAQGTLDHKNALPVSAHALFRLCAELGIPAEVQLEMPQIARRVADDAWRHAELRSATKDSLLPTPTTTVAAMQSIIPSLVTLALVVVLILVLRAKTSVCTILEDETVYQESEICRLEKLVKKSRSRYVLGLEEETRWLHALVNHHQGDVAYLTAEVQRLQEVLRGTVKLQEVADLAGNKIEALSVQVEELSCEVEAQNACIQDLTARYNKECTERAVVAAMNWAAEKENEELQQTIKELRRSSEAHQDSVCEVRQAAVIKTLQRRIKTAARLSAEQETKIRCLEKEIATKEKEKEEVVMLAEQLVMKTEAALNVQRRESKRYVKNLKKKWAVAWGWAAGEVREMRSRLGELREVDNPDDSFVSVRHLFEREVDDRVEDMSMCSVVEGKPSLVSPTNDTTPRPQRLPWVASPSKLAGRRLVRKIALSANALDSPFAFATNAVQFAPVETKYTKDRSAKRVKVDRP
ncbi:hypothetical protein B0H13DRAFT_1874741 [Mycena leptocephala]|nr:hypothetical protein B0H13DRAFT_1874741 [Mycena leptocephala]